MTLRKKYVNSALTNKTCNKCGNTYPRTEDYFYRKRHHARKDIKQNTLLVGKNNGDGVASFGMHI